MHRSTRYFRASAVNLLIVLGEALVFYFWKLNKVSFGASRDVDIWVAVILLILLGVFLLKGIGNLTIALWFKYFEHNASQEKFRKPAELFLASMVALPVGICSLRHGLSGLLHAQIEALGHGPFIPDVVTKFSHPIRYWYSLAIWLIAGILSLSLGVFVLFRALRSLRAK